VIGLADALPGLRRIDLITNYRCPAAVVSRSVRLIAHNRERFDKRIIARPLATGRLVLASDASDETVRIRRVVETWPPDGSTRAVLARTNRELLPAVVVALELNIPFRAPEIPLILESPSIDVLLERTRLTTPDACPAIVRLGAVLRSATVVDADEPFTEADVAAALLAWAAPYPDLDSLVEAIDEWRARLRDLRRADALLTFATAHSTKGLEFDHVAVIGLEAGRVPSARWIADASDPRALEEERRLAYVAWTRARRSLTLVYDPAVASQFLLEAFDPQELAPDDTDQAWLEGM
jgi:superfamily I DNA/RNA helicase